MAADHEGVTGTDHFSKLSDGDEASHDNGCMRYQ